MAVQPAGEGATGHLTHADAQGLAGRGTNGIRTPQLLAVHRRTQREVLAGLEAEGGGLPGGHVEGDDQRLCAFGPDAADAQGVEVQAAHIGLKYSKGSRHARQRCSALQAVEPKAERRSVSELPQRGQTTPRGRTRNVVATAMAALPLGGAMP